VYAYWIQEFAAGRLQVRRVLGPHRRYGARTWEPGQDALKKIKPDILLLAAG